MKIKKYALHILMLVILVTIFTPLFSINASVVDPSEPCNGPTIATSTNQPCQLATGLTGIMLKLQQLLNTVLPVLVALGVVYLVWGVVQYFIGDGDEAKKKGRDRIIFGIIGLAVIVGLWGLVYIVVDTFEVGGYSAPDNLDNLLP